MKLYARLGSRVCLAYTLLYFAYVLVISLRVDAFKSIKVFQRHAKISSIKLQRWRCWSISILLRYVIGRGGSRGGGPL